MNLIGTHARTMAELDRVTSIEGIDMVELKPDIMRIKCGAELYTFNGNNFAINPNVAREISDLCSSRGCSVQVHMPFERMRDASQESGLCQAETAHYPLILAGYRMMGELLRDYGIGTVLTTHPPAFMFDRKKICTEEEAIAVGRELYLKLGKLIDKEGYGFKVGVENMVCPKNKGSASVGYYPEQISGLIKGTGLGITIDTGHRMLNHKMSIAELVSIGSIVNTHFHTNDGKPTDEGYSDDQHVLAYSHNLAHYKRHIRGFAERGNPIVLEIECLDAIRDKELSEYVSRLREEILEEEQAMRTPILGW